MVFYKEGASFIKANTTTGYYRGQMNVVNFIKWIRKPALPSLPPKSVVVIDNAPYHGEQEDKVPNKSAT